MVESDDVLVPASTPRPAKRGLGCVPTVVLFLVVVAVGLIVGTMLSGDDDDGDEDARAVLISDGEVSADGEERAWRVEVQIDEADDTCIFLYEGDEQLTGACDDTPQAATLGPTTILFGIVERPGEVGVALSDGSQADVETFAVDGFEGRFYVEPRDGEVEALELVPVSGG